MSVGPTMTAPHDTLRSLYEAYLRKRPRQSRSRSVVEAVLEAAADLLARGEREDRLTVQQVAERAGVGIGSLYDYFQDRGSVLAGLAAKVTEDNLRELEQDLARVASLPIEQALEQHLGGIFDRYLRDVRLPRAILRIAHSVGLMPTLAASQTLFARSLAAILRAHPDVRVADPELTAYVMTNMTMGQVHTLLWLEDDPAFDRAALLREITAVWARHLRDDPAARAAPDQDAWRSGG